MFMNKAFSQSEYGRETKDGKVDQYINQEDDGGKNRDKNRNKKRTFVPNRMFDVNVILIPLGLNSDNYESISIHIEAYNDL